MEALVVVSGGQLVLCLELLEMDAVTNFGNL
jgi:hypothetical protein